MLQLQDMEALVLTRREKKTEARDAVQAALRCAPNGVVRVSGREADLHAVVLGIIRHYNFTAFPLDEIDVRFAVNKLHDSGIVRVAHYGPEFDRTHVVALRRP